MDLGKYHLIRELGKGGFGIVYEARDLSLDREVALKVLHPYLAADDEFVARFRKEAKALAKLEHPNIVPVYEFAHEQDRHYIAMRYLPGGSLSKRIAQSGGLSVEETLKITRQLIDALTYTHARGVTHCDIKPNNILFDALDNAMIADFGLARAAQTDVTAASTVLSSGAGTPSYMPPEMWEEKPITPAVDQYSLACVIYEMLTGDKLFRGDSTPGIMNKHFKPIVLPDSIPVGLRLVLRKALSKEPGERFVDLHELQRALDDFARTPVSSPIDHIQQAATTPPVSPGGKTVLPSLRGTKARTPKLPGKRPPAWLPVALVGVAAVAAVAIFSSMGKPSLPSEQAPLSELLSSPTATQTMLPSSEPQTTQTTDSLGMGSTRVRERDGMEQMYVPEGSFTMGSTTGEADEKPVRDVYLDAFWIDKYEVTNERYAQCVVAGVCTAPKSTGSPTRSKYFYEANFANYPVIYISWYQAQDYCKWVGGELPTEAQWEKAARGTDGRTYPWGNDSPTYKHASFGGSTQDTVEVGSHPQGASPYGVLDMAGNVWEWVQDWYGDYDERKSNNPTGSNSGELKVFRGGYWNYAEWGIRTTFRFYGDPTQQGNDTGFRCVSPQKSDATLDPLTTQAQSTAASQPNATQINTNALPSTSSPDSELGIGSTKIRQQDGMEMVYVPEGSFEMGSNERYYSHILGQYIYDELPVRQVFLDTYWIDKYEVTNGQYAQCVAAGICTEPKHTFSPTHSSYYSNASFVNYPVIYVSWYQARDYCQWVGGDLPTEAQWEKAARGIDGRKYPWGNEAINSSLVHTGLGNDSVEVGSYPQGASPYGALDMASNVYEWVRDWYGDYDANETINPTGPGSGSYRVIRGGSWYYSLANFRTANRNYSDPTDKYYYIGFRCANAP